MDADEWSIALREVARLLNLWNEHGFAPIAKETIYLWCQESASRCRLPPRPDVAFALLEVIPLISKDDEGNVVLPQQFTDAYPVTPAIDELPAVAAEYLLGRMLDLPDCQVSLGRVFASVPLAPGDLKFQWSMIDKPSRNEPGWIWLQQLGLCQHDGEVVVLNEVLRSYIADTLPSKRAVTQQELLERLELQQLMASLAEEYVLSIEKERLIKSGNDDLAANVYRLSLDDVAAGFDVLSYEDDGRLRRIEVKASAGPRKRFFITRNELEAAERFSSSYFLAWVAFADRLPQGPVEVAWFRNPAAILKLEIGPWTSTAEQFCVVRTGDDIAYLWLEP